eukprot:TRINITY_DN72415_c0_g1_i1.p1 TRINITY_DN72415_c0_g1~~TRINITY_DN72415_c0_g1_i1.p1  ORF type:complete len:138 (+),score=15.30 TRINITY_DN72415_c0_g1_i1:87-500(+)
MSASLLVTRKRIRVEYYVAPGVSVAHPEGPFEVRAEDTLLTLGRRFVEEIKRLSAEQEDQGSLLAGMIPGWAVVRSTTATTPFGRPRAKLSETGLFAAIEEGEGRVILVGSEQDSITVGLDEVVRPDEGPAGCCAIS